MFEALTAKAALDFAKANWKWIAGGLLVVIILTLAYCSGQRNGKSGGIIKQQDREIEVQHKVGDANEKAAGSRVDDATRLQRQQQEIEDAVRNASGPDDVRAKRGCVILRQQGRDTSAIPACRGS